ncbi:DUF4163 domain-containing protein [Clostridium sp. A1-XYC3]|uniref:DUF4163 domain-containing protein n=1 Tax=Clostridium tanneri TaxID=3037988 RepID=A0ABU4JQE7_9CLOT|nr:DUF4163 domain-containing protein [Clostridium sp. A1-XYC3]MDW8800326.1 DUF4163 domain-containing protein [Clostridium sp. A1-XYC3]
MKKILCLGLIGMLSLEGTYFVKAAPTPQHTPIVYVKDTQVTAQSKVKISTKEIKDIKEAYQIDLKIPVLEGIEDKEIQTSINSFIEKDALAFAEDIKNQGIQFTKDSKKQGQEVRPYTASTSYEVAYNKNNIVSIACTYYNYTLGAHGHSQIKTFNFDLTTGKELALKDLFDKSEDYFPIINKEIQKQIKADPNKYFTEKDNNFVTITSNQPFTIEDGNITLYFSLYEIAPYSTGIPEFKIPFSLFKKGVKTGIELKKDSIKVVPELTSEKNDVLSSDIQVPVLKNLKNEKLQSEINKAFKDRVLQIKDQMTIEGKEASEDAKNYGYEARPYSLSADYYISYNEKNILSITSTYYQYTGGAHGSTLMETSNVNLKTGEKIALKDLFKDGVNYKKLITEEIKKQIVSDDRFYSDASAALNTISDNQSFYIAEDGIVIYYQSSEIAPYAAGIPEFKIPFSMLKDSLKLDVVR